MPGQEELAFGAIASGGTTVFNEALVRALHLPSALLERVVEKEQKELERREKLYRHGKAAPDLGGKIVIIVDDGLKPRKTKTKVYCGACGESFYVDDVQFEQMNKVIEETPENPFLCKDCELDNEETQYED